MARKQASKKKAPPKASKPAKSAKKSAAGGKKTSPGKKKASTGGKKKAKAQTKTAKPAKAAPVAKAAAPAAKAAKTAKAEAKKPKSRSSKKSAASAPAAPVAEVATDAPPKKKKLKLSLSQNSLALSGGSGNRKVVKPPASSLPMESRPEPPSEAQLKRVKTDLTRGDKERYRRMLIDKKQEILGDVASLSTESRNQSGGDLSHMPVHMADVGSDQFEQEFTLGLVESERKLLREIDDALIRLKRGTYGVCLETGTPIAKERLDAKPWAKYCIEVVRELERRGQR